MRAGYVSEAAFREAVQAECDAARLAERGQCIKWLEQEAAQASNPAHKRVLTGIIHDLLTGAHVAETKKAAREIPKAEKPAND